MGIKERKEREKEARRRQILNAAKEVFLANGFNASTMEDIAGHEELSVATIYTYFKSKEELYVSLYLDTLQHFHDLIEKALRKKSLTVEEKIIAIRDALYNTFRHDPLSLLNIFRVQLDGTLLSFSDDLLKQLNHLGRKIQKMIAAVYEEGVKSGYFPPGHSMQHADIIWGVFTGLVLWEEAKSRLDPTKQFLKPTLDRAFDILLSGLKAIQVDQGP